MRDVKIGAADADTAGSHLKSHHIMRKTVDIVTVVAEIISEGFCMSNWMSTLYRWLLWREDPRDYMTHLSPLDNDN